MRLTTAKEGELGILSVNIKTFEQEYINVIFRIVSSGFSCVPESGAADNFTGRCGLLTLVNANLFSENRFFAVLCG